MTQVETPIPFSSCVLCLNCEHVSATPTDTCPKCSNRGLLNLKAVFHRLTHQHTFSGEGGVIDGSHLTILRCSCGETRDITEFARS